MDLGGSTASDTDGMTFARRPDAVLTAVGDLHRHPLLTDGHSTTSRLHEAPTMVTVWHCLPSHGVAWGGNAKAKWRLLEPLACASAGRQGLSRPPTRQTLQGGTGAQCHARWPRRAARA